MGKYLFLDPSDVLSAGEYPDGEKYILAHKLSMENVIRIIEETGCKLVLISNPLYYLHTQGNWLKALNDKSMDMGYPKQFQFYSATPSIWADDIKWLCPVASWNKRFKKSLDGLGVATWLCLNAEPDARYAIITRGKENEFMKNQKENLFVCKNTGVTEEIADLIIEMFNGIAFY